VLNSGQSWTFGSWYQKVVLVYVGLDVLVTLTVEITATVAAGRCNKNAPIGERKIAVLPVLLTANSERRNAV
jgi:hypothetical protein